MQAAAPRAFSGKKMQVVASASKSAFNGARFAAGARKSTRAARVNSRRTAVMTQAKVGDRPPWTLAPAARYVARSNLAAAGADAAPHHPHWHLNRRIYRIPQIGDSLAEFLAVATPDPKLRLLMSSMGETIRTIAFKVRPTRHDADQDRRAQHLLIRLRLRCPGPPPGTQRAPQQGRPCLLWHFSQVAVTRPHTRPAPAPASAGPHRQLRRHRLREQLR